MLCNTACDVFKCLTAEIENTLVNLLQYFAIKACILTY
ncbi:hypothetical protein APHNP_0251 [Anaplasma phagocytophilum str. ApNP]|uniref:Uncharacterized protein n=1 Tax=Anaplasma phagocytophilum str. ApNP TaxID=1359153 RepID=A0A0F3NIL0_ANAPH|nr:hypothetical protein APHNP_0251 [Anaplasma phagocytophilum str. ApNP]